MGNIINAHCAICGCGYYLCKSCQDQKKIKPWRSVTDTIEHYKIYMAIYGYTISGNKELAQSELQKCNLEGLNNFNSEIKSVINEILNEPEVKASTRKKKNYVESQTDKNEISE